MSEERDGTADAVTEDTTVATTEADEAQAQGDEQSGDDAAAEAEGEGEGDKPSRPRKSVQDRIDEKTRAQKDAERRAEEAERDREYWREQALRNQRTPPRQDQPDEEAEPSPDNYEYGTSDARFIEDRAVFRARKEFEAGQAKAEAERQRNNQVSTFNSAAQVIADKTPDYYDVVGSDFGKIARLCTPVMNDALLTSEAGPELAYHLAKSPSEARRIAALSPIAQAMELGRLAQKLASPSAPAAKTATDAPLPTTQVRGAGGKFGVAPDTTDFAAFEKLAAAKG